MIDREWNWSAIHRPYVVRWFWNRREWGIVLCWGDRNGDPVWRLGFDRSEPYDPADEDRANFERTLP